MDDQNTQDQIQEGEVIDAAVDNNTSIENGEAIVLQNLESLIKGNISQLDKLSDELKKHKEMIDSVFENDSTFKAHADAAKEAARVKTATKNEILKRPEVSHVNEKMKDVKSEIQEIRDSLSSYLQEYQRLSGSSEIEGEDGQVRQIVYTAKLIKRSSRP